MRHEEHGYIALIMVLVTGALAAAVAVLLLATASNSSRETLVVQASTQARSLATACGEEALAKIQVYSGYTGTDTYSLATGTCTYTVANTSGTFTIDGTANVGNVTRRMRIIGTIVALSISITSWQEVGS